MKLSPAGICGREGGAPATTAQSGRQPRLREGNYAIRAKPIRHLRLRDHL